MAELKVEDEEQEASSPVDFFTSDDFASMAQANTKVFDRQDSKFSLASVDGHESIWTEVSKTVLKRQDAFFNGFVSFLVFANAIVLGLEADYNLGLAGEICDHLFTTVWCVEMIIRMRSLGLRKYMLDRWCFLDFVLAWMSIFDVWIIPGTGMRNFSVLRTSRMVRLVRMLKVVRAFKELWLLVHGMVQALSALSWVVLLLLAIVYVSALLMRSLVGVECDSTYQEFEQCYEMFGSVLRTMYTLFQVLTLESWSMAVARPIMEEKPGLVVMFVVYLFITSFGLLNIVSGILVEQVLQASREHEEKVSKAKLEEEKRVLRHLTDIFTKADEDGSGHVDIHEFLSIVKQEDVKATFDKLELPVASERMARRLFEVLDVDGDGSMEIREFLGSAQRLKNEGRLIHSDPTLLLASVRFLDRVLAKVEPRLQRVEAMLMHQYGWVIPERDVDQESIDALDEGMIATITKHRSHGAPSGPTKFMVFNPQHQGVTASHDNPKVHSQPKAADSNRSLDSQSGIDSSSLQLWLEKTFAECESRMFGYLDTAKRQMREDIAVARRECREHAADSMRNRSISDVVMPLQSGVISRYSDGAFSASGWNGRPEIRS